MRFSRRFMDRGQRSSSLLKHLMSFQPRAVTKADRSGTLSDYAASNILSIAFDVRAQGWSFGGHVREYAPRQYTFSDAAHLLRRAGFAGPTSEVEALQKLGPNLAVERLLYASTDDNTIDNPFDVRALFLERQAGSKANIDPKAGLSGWWVHRLAHSSQPLKEKLVLFWHGHFATELQKVDNPFAMQQQNELFRQKGLGRFADLMLEVAKNPAMLRYLDNNRNVKGKPNENFARELVELFTIGVHGGYTEHDVQESARAFTGWTFQTGNRDKPEENDRFTNPTFVFNKKNFDGGEKTYLGQSGKLTGEDIVRIVTAHPSTAKFIITKLWKFFVGDTISPNDLAELTALWNSSGGEIAVLLRAIFKSEVFYAKSNRHALIKSPVEYAIGMLRSSSARLALEQSLGIWGAMRVMGQTLFEPPNVKGWDGGSDWVSDTTLLNRLNLVGAVTQRRLPAQLRKDQAAPPTVLTLPSGSSLQETIELLGKTYLGEKPDGALLRAMQLYADGKNTPEVAKGLAYLVLASPQYHLA